MHSSIILSVYTNVHLFLMPKHGHVLQVSYKWGLIGKIYYNGVLLYGLEMVKI